MVKAYYRYEHALQFGVIASPNCNVACGNEGQRIYTAALENVNVWNIRTGERVRSLQAMASRHFNRRTRHVQLALSISKHAAGHALTVHVCRWHATSNCRKTAAPVHQR